MLELCIKMGCRMPHTIHFPHFQLKFFPEDFGVVGEEHGGRFLK